MVKRFPSKYLSAARRLRQYDGLITKLLCNRGRIRKPSVYGPVFKTDFQDGRGFALSLEPQILLPHRYPMPPATPRSVIRLFIQSRPENLLTNPGLKYPGLPPKSRIFAYRSPPYSRYNARNRSRMCNEMADPKAMEKDRIIMSNKRTIKRTAEPVKKKKEEKKVSFAKSRTKLMGLIPAIVFIVIAIWYFLSSLQ